VVTLAHQGGWDELLFVVVPITLFSGLLWLANRRAATRRRGRRPLDVEPAVGLEVPVVDAGSSLELVNRTGQRCHRPQLRG
jgi:hypothetical protein